MTTSLTRQDVRAARDDVGAFARLFGAPLTTTQADALRFDSRTTVIVAPRQTGKSRTLAVAALWWAFRRPEQTVLIISAGEAAASRLLSSVRRIAGASLLAASVLDETASVVTLSNGSTIRSVPASERQVRGWSVDLLILDEAAYLDEDLVHSAALPTTAARPDARIVMASSPWSDSGPFWSAAVAGEHPTPLLRTVRWSLADAPWVDDAAVESARLTMSEPRFRAEYLAEFVGGADRFLPVSDLRASTLAYALPTRAPGSVIGLDWGRQFDGHALVAAAALADGGANDRPVAFVAYCETSRRPYGEQVRHVDATVRRLGARLVLSETNGVGAMPTEEVSTLLRRHATVEGVASSQRSKEDAYGRLRALLTSGRLVLPDDPELLRQLGGIVAEASPSGGLSIRAVSEALHDDLPDALSLAVSRLGLRPAPRRPVEAVEWVETAHGTRVPLPVAAGQGRTARLSRSVGSIADVGRGRGVVEFDSGRRGPAPSVGGWRR